MAYLRGESRYDKYPETIIRGYEDQAWQGEADVGAEISRAMNDRRVAVVDCYPGVDDEALLPALMKAIKPDQLLLSEEAFLSGDEMTERMRLHLTEDRVRGIMYYGDILDFIDTVKLDEMRAALASFQGTVLIYGFGASLISEGDLLIYADMARWEIQQRYRRGMPNYKQHNGDQDILRKYKRGFFIEWRIADRHKRALYEKISYYLDANAREAPRMVTGDGLRQGLKCLTRRPFRLVPYFDPGVWGGQWMKQVCGLDADAPNYAWSFDGVPEENSLYLRYGDVRIESPAMNLVQYCPRELLGERTYARFGAEFPIRFDFLDTMGGQNLSLQVHPTTEYIKTKFGMPYTQDESYYILDTEGESSGVYLGLKEGVDPDEMLRDLELAQQGGEAFPADRYVNRFPARRHDHFLIPAGTIHCSSAGCMVLEVSATPYIFTFKLWDWGRVDLNGKPRPIHIEDGARVLRFDRDTAWVRENLINRFKVLSDGPEGTETRTGLHEWEFIETRVLRTTGSMRVSADGEFAMLNLVEGQAMVVESPENRFEPFTVHYVETFIIPARAGDYTIRPAQMGQEIRVLKANVRYG